MSDNIFNKIVNIDLYINYQCGLRCNHCFIGEALNTNKELDFSLAKTIIRKAKHQGLKSVTLLGGEPTLYSKIELLINYIISQNLELRIVTNGQKPCYRLILKLSKSVLENIHFCFSIDGSTDHVQENIRGKGTFNNLIQSLNLAKATNLSMSGITSISQENKHDVLNIVDICNSYNLNYLNIHYVTDRGFAKRSMIIPHNEWLALCQKIENHTSKMPIRLEKTFVSIKAIVDCEVNKKESLIIDPLGKVYGCTIFMNLTNAESGIFDKNGYKENSEVNNENNICNCESTNGCPGMKIANKELVDLALKNNLKMDCFFNKTLLN